MTELKRRLFSAIFGHKKLAGWCVGLLAYSALYYAFSDQLTFTAYYPSPMGSYSNLYSTNNTWLAASGGQVVIGVKQNPHPAVALDVEGTGNMYVQGLITTASGVQPGALTVPPACNATTNNGMIAVTTVNGTPNTPGYCNGPAGQWQPLGNSGAAIITLTGYNPTCPSGTQIVDKYYSPATSCLMVAYTPRCWYCTVNTTVDWWSNGGGVGSFEGNIACLSDQWSQVKCFVPPNCSVSSAITTISGTNPQCPSGTQMGGQAKYWSAKTCSVSCTFVDTFTYSCTTPVQWGASSTCPYTTFRYYSTCDGMAATCTADSWTQIQCEQDTVSCH